MQYFKNQNVDVVKDGTIIKVVCNQLKSTPGIFFRVTLQPYESYLIKFKGKKKSKGVVKLWVAYSDNKCIDFSDENSLKYHITNIEYVLKNTTSKPVSYKVGILFTRARIGNYFLIYNYEISKIKTSNYLYIYHYKKNSGHYNTIWQLFIRDKAEKYIDCIEITKLTNQLVKEYDTIIIDYYALARYNPLPNRQKYLNMLKNGKKIAIYLHDMHEYTFIVNNQLKKSLSNDNIPFNKPNIGVKHFIKFMKDYNIKYLISRCECKEFDNILLEGKNFIKNHYYLPHHINSNYNLDYGYKKEYDILIYGATYKSSYPFRARLKELLLKSNFRIKYISKKNPIYGEDLAKLLNKSWIAIATKSNFDYLVCKYFEISGSKCVIAGNMPEQGKKIWGDSYIHLDEKMTDKNIINKLDHYLKNKILLYSMMDTMYKIIHQNYTYKHFAKKLFYLCEHINGNIDDDPTKMITFESIKKVAEKQELYIDKYLNVCHN